MTNTIPEIIFYISWDLLISDSLDKMCEGNFPAINFNEFYSLDDLSVKLDSLIFNITNFTENGSSFFPNQIVDRYS